MPNWLIRFFFRGLRKGLKDNFIWYIWKCIRRSTVGSLHSAVNRGVTGSNPVDGGPPSNGIFRTISKYFQKS